MKKNKKDLIWYLDKISAVIILVSIFGINYNSWFWLSYAMACAMFTYINKKKNLWGQAIMNLVAVVISLFNILHVKP